MSLEECKAPCGPANHEAIGELMDGRGEVAGAMVKNEQQSAKLLDQLRFQHEVLAEIYDLTDPASRTPLADRDICRIKAAVALKAAQKSGLLS